MPKYKNIILEKCYISVGNLNSHCTKHVWWIKKGLTDVYDDIIEYTSFLPEHSKFVTRIYHYLNGINNIPKCHRNSCDNNVNWQIGYGYSKYCSKSCNALDNAKYGSDNRFSKQETKEKIKKTNLEKYGSENVSNSDHFQEKISEYWGSISEEKKANVVEKRKSTNLDKYGFTTPFMAESVKEKITATMLERYGVEKPLQNSEILAKQRQTNIDRYGTPNYLRKDYSEELTQNIDNKEWFEQQIDAYSTSTISSTHNISASCFWAHCRRHGIELVSRSSFENEIYTFIESMTNCDVIRGDKTILGGKEIDIYIPDMKLAIECNGIYWHSEVAGRRDKNYHLDKTIKCEEKGIRLVHIFETEWYDKSDIVKSILNINKQIVIQARKCDIVVVDNNAEREFLDMNHIQGYTSSKVCYGLVYDGELVSLMSFGKPRYSKKYEWELIRYSNKLDVAITGGANRLFKKFCEDNSPNAVVSYSDRRLFTGNVYKNLGFEFSHYSSPNYFYMDSNVQKLQSRHKYQKHKLHALLENFDPNLTEWDNMQNNGFDRIWDCGNSVWVFNTPTR